MSKLLKSGVADGGDFIFLGIVFEWVLKNRKYFEKNTYFLGLIFKGCFDIICYIIS